MIADQGVIVYAHAAAFIGCRYCRIYVCIVVDVVATAATDVVGNVVVFADVFTVFMIVATVILKKIIATVRHTKHFNYTYIHFCIVYIVI